MGDGFKQRTDTALFEALVAVNLALSTSIATQISQQEVDQRLMNPMNFQQTALERAFDIARLGHCERFETSDDS